MKISNNWLKEYIKTDLPAEKIGEYLTDIGVEVEGIERYESIKGSLEGIVVGKVLTCEKHPNADKLSKTTVDVGHGHVLEIVCGAPNVAAGQTVAVAMVGTVLYSKEGESFTINKTKIRGEVSEGMLCAEDEIGLGSSHEGIMILDDSYEIGKPLMDYYPNIVQDEVYEIGLTPNRTDAISHYGVARDLHAYLSCNGQKSELIKPKTIEKKNEGEHGFSIEIEHQELCPKYIGAVIENVKVAESPDWLKNNLKAIGLAPINNVVDITNYILHGCGQPLHAFDAEKIAGKKIIVGKVEKGTLFTTLDGIERKLTGEEIMIKDGNHQPLCIAGVFGGKESGVAENTQTIFLESAYFNPVAVRKAAKSHGLNTDASFRFERGIDPHYTKEAMSLAVTLIEELTGGRQVGGYLEFYPQEIKPHQVTFRYSKLEQILGVSIPKETIKQILGALEITINQEKSDELELSIPNYRADVTREIDVIEEILRIYGYNKVESPQKIAFTPIKLSVDDQDALENEWARTLQSNGFFEVMNNSLTLVKEDPNAVKLLNPLSNDLAFMRTSLLEGLLGNTAYNINRKNADIKFFELGKIYHKKQNYEERKQLALITSGRNHKENWILPQSKTNFYDIKAYVQLILSKLNLNIVEEALEDQRFSDGIVLRVDSQEVARIGKVTSSLLKEYDIEQEVFYAEIEIETCQKLRTSGQLKFKDIPKFNKTRRDLALLIDKHVTYAALYQTAKKNPSPFIKEINLFDVYEGKNLPVGKKSYALSFELLNEEKTLEEREIAQVMESLVDSFKKEFDAELRS